MNSRLDRYLGIPLVIIGAVIRPMAEILWRPLVRFFWNFGKRRSRHSKVLVIKMSGVPDEAMLPALYLLREHFKEAEIVFLGNSSSAAFAGRLNFFDRVELFSFRTVMDLVSERFMMTLDFEPEMRTSALVASYLRCPLTAGFRTAGQFRHYAFDHVGTWDGTKSPDENLWGLVRSACKECGRITVATFDAHKSAALQKWKS